MSFSDLQAELIGSVPKLPAGHAGQLINRAWSRIRDYRLWSFQVIADAQIFVPDVITAGTVTVTFNSTAVVADVTAAAALNAVALANPPLAGGLGVGRQFRIGAVSGISAPTGPNYPIVSWDNPSRTLTLDRPYGGDTGGPFAYQVLKVYYAAPAFPFTSTVADPGLIRFTSIVNRVNGYAFSGKNLNWTQESLNAIDPQRGGQGDTYIQANYGRIVGVPGILDGTPAFELYPNPVKRTTYTATYITRWPDLSVNQDLPQMPYGLVDTVMHCAKYFADNWALRNVSTFPELQGTNWVAAAQMDKAEFKEALIQSIKVDDEIMPWPALRQGPGFSFPLGGQFLQSHDLSSIIGG